MIDRVGFALGHQLLLQKVHQFSVLGMDHDGDTGFLGHLEGSENNIIIDHEGRTLIGHEEFDG